MTLVFSPAQAILAAEIGAYIVSPFLGRLDDVGSDGMYTAAPDLRHLRGAGLRDERPRRPRSAIRCTSSTSALAGADIATMPYDVFTKLVKHPLTDHRPGASFLADWATLQKASWKERHSLMDTTQDRSVLEGKLIPELQQIAQAPRDRGRRRSSAKPGSSTRSSSGATATAPSNGPVPRAPLARHGRR